MTEVSQLVIFDLDNTLTRRDTLVPYLLGYLTRKPWKIFRTLHLPVAALLFKLRVINNARLKEIFITALLAGASREVIQHWSGIFIRKLLAHGMRKDGIEILNQHIKAGDYTILLSASPDIYVYNLGAHLGFRKVICTRTEWESGRLTGRLANENCRGSEKVKCLDKLRKEFPNASITAYADNCSDIDLLRSADKGILVNGTRKAHRIAYPYGIDTQTWRK